MFEVDWWETQRGRFGLYISEVVVEEAGRGDESAASRRLRALEDIYNALGVPIAAGVLYPVFGLLLSPIIAAAAMSFSSVSVITNALRLRSIDV